VISAESWRRSSLGLLMPPSTRAPCLRHGKPIAVELFCGAGGFGVGLKMAGFHVAAASDSWTLAALTYMTNLGAYPIEMHFIEEADAERMEAQVRKEMERAGKAHVPLVSGSGWISGRPRDEAGQPIHGCEHFFLGDVRKLTGAAILAALELDVGDVDVVTGGPPCQGFSRAGKQDVMDPRNSLVFEFTRLIAELRPKAFIMENVPGLLKMITPEGVPVIDALTLDLEDRGYGTRAALKTALQASSGAGAAVRAGARPKRRSSRAGASTAKPEVEQGSLYDAASS